MSHESGYSEQKNLSSVQLLAEVPTLIETLLSAVFSNALLLYVDLLDSLGYIIRYALVIILSKKLSKNLQYEYNYGIGKIEAISSLLCDGIVLFGMFLTSCISVYSIFFPSRPSDLLLGVAGFKLYDIIWDLAFFVKQRKILKSHQSAMIETNYAAALGALLFDVLAFASLMAMWLLRNNPIGGYISPVVSLCAVVYLTIGCMKRIKTALDELTDKTLPEEQQMKILNVLTRHYNSYSQFHSISSRKSGEITLVDICLSFEEDARVEAVTNLQKQMQEELNGQLGNCVVNVIVKNEQVSKGEKI
jgi:divalent metal cation (Fe/Co/Zn/Cd) transporter